MTRRSLPAVILVTLRFPSSALFVNAQRRQHWTVRASHAAQSRMLARAETNASFDAAALSGWQKFAGCCAVTIEATPPDARRRDIDGIVSALKSSIDGVFDALGLDDSRVQRLNIARYAPSKSLARVRIVVTPLTAAETEG